VVSEADLKVGRVFSSKRPQRAGLFTPLLNDRSILYVNTLDRTMQYDSPTVRDGRHYPKVSFDAFLRWAKDDVTDLCPPGEWRSAP
jgi:hypothetical protein